MPEEKKFNWRDYINIKCPNDMDTGVFKKQSKIMKSALDEIFSEKNKDLASVKEFKEYLIKLKEESKDNLINSQKFYIYLDNNERIQSNNATTITINFEELKRSAFIDKETGEKHPLNLNATILHEVKHCIDKHNGIEEVKIVELKKKIKSSTSSIEISNLEEELQKINTEFEYRKEALSVDNENNYLKNKHSVPQRDFYPSTVELKPPLEEIYYFNEKGKSSLPKNFKAQKATNNDFDAIREGFNSEQIKTIYDEGTIKKWLEEIDELEKAVINNVKKDTRHGFIDIRKINLEGTNFGFALLFSNHKNHETGQLNKPEIKIPQERNSDVFLS